VQNKFYSNIYCAIAHGEKNEFDFKFKGNRREIAQWSYIEKPEELEVGDYYAYVHVEPS
jgi:hypothetical protein